MKQNFPFNSEEKVLIKASLRTKKMSFACLSNVPNFNSKASYSVVIGLEVRSTTN
jgi:hypothetical protein